MKQSKEYIIKKLNYKQAVIAIIIGAIIGVPLIIFTPERNSNKTLLDYFSENPIEAIIVIIAIIVLTITISFVVFHIKKTESQ